MNFLYLYKQFIASFVVSILLMSSENSLLAQNGNERQWCEFIENVQIYQDSVELNVKRCIKIKPNSFSIEKYIQFFDKLYFPKNFKCDIFYNDLVAGGEPLLYAIDDTINIEDFISLKMKEAGFSSDDCLDTVDFIRSLYENNFQRAKYLIRPEISKIGFLQYLFFIQFGERFALWWHSNYNWGRLISNADELRQEILGLSKSGLHRCDKENIDSALTINPTPEIHLDEDKCLISWFELNHYGIYKKTFVIDKKFPHDIDRVSSETILYCEFLISY